MSNFPFSKNLEVLAAMNVDVQIDKKVLTIALVYEPPIRIAALKLGQYINKNIDPINAIKFEWQDPEFYLHFRDSLFLIKKEAAKPKYAPNI